MILEKINKVILNRRPTILVVIALATVAIAVMGYLVARSEIKQQRSLQLIQEFYSEPMLEYFFEANKLVTQSLLKANPVDKSLTNEEKVLEYYHNIIKELEEPSAKYEYKFYALFHFFDMVAACINKRLCDRPIIDRLLKPKIDFTILYLALYMCKNYTELINNQEEWQVEWRDLELYIASRKGAFLPLCKEWREIEETVK